MAELWLTDSFCMNITEIYKINSTNNILLKRYGNSTLFTCIYIDAKKKSWIFS